MIRSQLWYSLPILFLDGPRVHGYNKIGIDWNSQPETRSFHGLTIFSPELPTSGVRLPISCVWHKSFGENDQKMAQTDFKIRPRVLWKNTYKENNSSRYHDLVLNWANWDEFFSQW
jgi:hypothetical protein